MSATLEFPFSELHGKMKGKSTIYYAIRMGKQITSSYPKTKNKWKISDKQKQRYSVFQQAVKRTADILADEQQKALWLERFRQQKNSDGKQYKILRNFIIANITKQLEQENQP